MRSMMRALALSCFIGAAVSLPAVAQSTPKAEPPFGTPELAVQRLLTAVADSNLAEIANAWGTPNGPASKVKPQDWQRRVAIIQAYLRGGDYRVLGIDQTASIEGPRRTILVEIRRDNCQKQFPMRTVRLSNGTWLVTSVDLTTVGVPGKQCENN